MIFWLYCFPVILGLLLFIIFCRFCLSKYNYYSYKDIQYKMTIWKFLLYIIWVFIPLLNWACVIILLVALEDRYSIKNFIIDFFKTNKYVKFLNKEI